MFSTKRGKGVGLVVAGGVLFVVAQLLADRMFPLDLSLEGFLSMVALLYGILGVLTILAADSRWLGARAVSVCSVPIVFVILVAFSILKYRHLPSAVGGQYDVTGTIAHSLVLAPVAAGYLLGSLRLNHGNHSSEYELPLIVSFAVGAIVVADLISRMSGSAPGFTEILFGLAGIGAVLCAIPAYMLARTTS